MPPGPWVHFFNAVDPSIQRSIALALGRSGLGTGPMPAEPSGFGLMVLSSVDEQVLAGIRAATRCAVVLALVAPGWRMASADWWALLHAGAADVLLLPEALEDAEMVRARLARLVSVREIVESPRVSQTLVGSSQVWHCMLRQVVEIALYSREPVLITGESGTGKELIARVIHDLDPRADKRDLVTVDCTTITPELSGSEFFGHERGAFTGALTARDGAFALAHGGTLFLDEIGELPPVLQAQLLRVVQEGKYKRVGSNSWQHTNFRLLSATNRDLETEVREGRFRADLYYRIAGSVCRAPALRERKEDVLALALHFQAGPAATDNSVVAAGFDEPVRQYLLSRDYPGNVRELRRLIARLCQRHVGGGPISIGAVPPEERPLGTAAPPHVLDGQLRAAVREAVMTGLGLKEIGQAATECAIQIAIEQEQGNLHRAAMRLGVTDRALQLRRAQHRHAQ